MSHFSALRMQDTSSDYVKATVAGAGPDQKAGGSLEGASPTPFRRVRSFSTSTSESPCKPSSLPFAAATLLSLGISRSHSTCPTTALAPKAAAAAAAAAPTPAEGRERGGEWGLPCVKAAASAAASALSKLPPRARVPSNAGAKVSAKDCMKVAEGGEVSQQQPQNTPDQHCQAGPPSLPPCRTTDPETQPQASIVLPNSLDSNSSTPTAYPLAALLSHSLLQALGSPLMPGSPQVLNADATGEQHQQQQQATRSLFSATASHSEDQVQGVVRACVASGMSIEQAHALSCLVSSHPGMSLESMVAALPNCCPLDDLAPSKQQQVCTDMGDSFPPPPFPSPRPMSAMPPAYNTNTLPNNSGTQSNRSSNTSIGSSVAMSSSSWPVHSPCDLLSSSNSGMFNGGMPIEVCEKEATCENGNVSNCLRLWGEEGHESDFSNGQTSAQQQRGGEKGQESVVSPDLSGAAAPNPAPHTDPAHVRLPCPPPTTPWDFTYLLGLLEQQRKCQADQQQQQQQHQQQQQRQSDLHANASTPGLVHDDLRGGQQLLEWMEWQHQQQQQDQRFQQQQQQCKTANPPDSDSFLHNLRVRAPSPVSQGLAVQR